ncbi:MAG: glutamate racemase [Deltaproteobacteria bacterium]
MPKHDHPIGIFDSGIGGLTVFRAVMERLPFENIIYFGDTARVPYGIKSEETIIAYATEIAQFLVKQKVKMLIIACNTMAAIARTQVEGVSPLPVLDVIDAGAKIAIEKTKTKRIGVIGTPATINSNAYARAICSYDADAHVFSQACPLFVPLVEEGWLNHQVTRITAEEYLKPLLAEHIDTLVLGCTHYPLLKPLLQEIVGNEVHLVDSAEAMADRTAEILAESFLSNNGQTKPEYNFFVTDVPHRFHAVGENFLGRTLKNIRTIKL